MILQAFNVNEWVNEWELNAPPDTFSVISNAGPATWEPVACCQWQSIDINFAKYLPIC